MKRLLRFSSIYLLCSIFLASCSSAAHVTVTAEATPSSTPTPTPPPAKTPTPLSLTATATPTETGTQVADYFGLGPAKIEVVNQTEDKTAELMANPEKLPEASLNSKRVSSAGGATLKTVGFDSVIVSQATLSNVDLGNDSKVDGKQIEITVVYKYQGKIHTAHVLARGVLWTGNIDPVETYFSRLQPGTRINLELGILTAGTKEVEAKQLRTVWQNDPKWPLIQLAKSGFGQNNMNFTDLQSLVANGTLDVDSQTISCDFINPIQ